MLHTTLFLPGLSPVQQRKIHACFDGGSLSSDGGALLLREIETGMGIAKRLAASLPDMRVPGRTLHSYEDMIRERMIAICCGYEDCNDLDDLRYDPIFKMSCGRLPDSGQPLASQPTLSRLENLPCRSALLRMGQTMVDLFCDSFKTRPSHITLDIDDTTDIAHGNQQLSLFNTPAGDYCFQPIHIYDAETQKPVCIYLRPGKRPSGKEAATVLRFVIRCIRKHWPEVRITVRGDAHYGTPEVMALLERDESTYIFGLTVNKTLKDVSKPWSEDVTERYSRTKKGKLRRFFQTTYKAGSWPKKRKVVARIEASDKGTDVRMIVTNLPGRAKVLYEKIYCQRGRMENLIKEHKLYTRSDRTSCHRWQANQFRLFLHTGAYWLLLMLRDAAPKKSSLRIATFETIRRCILKIAVRVEQLKSRIKVSFPTSCPSAEWLVLLGGNIQDQSP